MTRPHIGADERRARIGLRHRLAPGAQAGSVAEAAASMVALHATDATSVYLEARARVAASSPATIEHELYEERTVLRLIAMRRTLFLVPLAASRSSTRRRRSMSRSASGGGRSRCSPRVGSGPIPSVS